MESIYDDIRQDFGKGQRVAIFMCGDKYFAYALEKDEEVNNSSEGLQFGNWFLTDMELKEIFVV